MKYPLLRLLKPTDFLQAVALMAGYERRREALERGCPPDRLPGLVCNRRDVLRLELEEYRRHADPLTRSFQRVARFLHAEAIFDADDLPYLMQVVVMAPMMAVAGERIRRDRSFRRFREWFYCSAVSDVYSRSREATAAKDLLEVPGWLDGGEVPTTVKEAHISAARLRSVVSSQSSTYRAIAALLRRDGALDFASGESIDAARYFDTIPPSLGRSRK